MCGHSEQSRAAEQLTDEKTGQIDSRRSCLGCPTRIKLLKDCISCIGYNSDNHLKVTSMADIRVLLRYFAILLAVYPSGELLSNVRGCLHTESARCYRGICHDDCYNQRESDEI